MLKIAPKTEKKIMKKFKDSVEGDIFDYIESIIRCAYKITDGGKISSCREGGSYIFYYYDNVTLTLNSKNFEILSLSTN